MCIPNAIDKEIKRSLCCNIGLDPAMPKFDHASAEGRLDTTDADFVDVIHSCAGTLGIKKSIGHIDFYPNNGEGKTFYC